MAKTRAFVQKWLFEIRYDPRPSMFWLGGELSDRWIKDFPELEVTLPNYILRDAKNYRQVHFGYFNSILDIEGQNDIKPFISLCKRLANDVVEIVNPPQISRLGLRQITMMPGTSRQRALSETLDHFVPLTPDWDTRKGKDQISDIGIVLDFKVNPSEQGQVQFGPYAPGVNNVQNFIYSNQPDLASVNDGYIFNCDYGIEKPDKSLLESERLEEWLYKATTSSRERIEKIRHYVSGTE